MRLKTSLFNPTLFRKNLTRFWPIWTVYGLIWLLMLPASLITEYLSDLRYGIASDAYLQRIAERYILTYTSDIGVPLAFSFGVLAAMAVFSYLYSARSAGMMHTLPIRREGLFLTNFLSGYCFFLFPHIAVAVLMLLAEAVAGVFSPWKVFLWMLVQGGTCLFFYTFAVFCAMFTGHLLALPVFYGILNFLVLILSALLEALLSMFTFGYTSGNELLRFAEWFTPVTKLAETLRFRSVVENGVETQLFTGFQYVLLYAGVAVIFFLCALSLYRSRHIECAGDVVAVGWAKPVFKFSFAFCSALCGGMLLYEIFSPMFDSVVLPLTGMMLFAGVIGCLIAEMLLQKSFKVLRRGWRGNLIFLAAVILFMGSMSRDLFGLESWVPSPVGIKTVYVSFNFPPYDDGTYKSQDITDPELIAKALDIHQAIVDNREALDQPRRSGDKPYVHLYFDYNFLNNSNATRSYSIPLNVDDPNDPLCRALLSFLNDPDRLLASYFPAEEDRPQAVGGELNYYSRTPAGGFLPEHVTLTAEQAQIIANAARRDIEAGRLGIRYLHDDDPVREANCSVTDLNITWLCTDPKTGSTFTRHSSITPQFTATSLLAALDELGFLTPEKHLLSYTDLEAVENGEKYGYPADIRPIPSLSSTVEVPTQYEIAVPIPLG